MRLNGLDLNQLLCLQALLSERSVTQAAEQVHLSQSAMSTALRQLRHHFGDPILVRSGRGLVLTPFGKSLIAPLSEVMAKTQMLAALRPGQEPSEFERELKIVASDYGMTTVLAKAVRLACEQMPGLTFDILPLSPASSHVLKSGEADLIVAGDTFKVDVPPNETLFDDNFVCVLCNKTNPKSLRLSADDYMERSHVVVRYFERQMVFEDEEALVRAGERRRHTVSVWSFSLVPHLIVGTRMVATVFSRIADGMKERWPIRIAPFPFDHEPNRIHVYWHSSRDNDAVLATFMRIVRTVAAESKLGD